MAIPTWCHDGTALDLLRVARSQRQDPLPRQILAAWLRDNAVATGDEDSCDLSEALQKSFSTDQLVLLPPEIAQRLHPFVGALQGWFQGVQDNSDAVARLWLLAPNSIELAPGVWLELQPIPAGTFLMGSPKMEKGRRNDETRHEVTLTQPFLIGKYPVTQAQWRAVMGSNPSYFQSDNLPVENVSWDNRSHRTNRSHRPSDNLPVENVSWDDAQSFCVKVHEKTGHTVCLPTEAQWEYSCRAGTSTPFHFGQELNGTQANCDGNYPYGTTQKGPYLGKTSPVGSYPANAWGLYDMHGNVWEWCQDWYGDYPKQSVTDPRGPEVGSICVIRGRSWYYEAAYCRSASRNGLVPSYRFSCNGFRLALGSSGIPR